MKFKEELKVRFVHVPGEYVRVGASLNCEPTPSVPPVSPCSHLTGGQKRNLGESSVYLILDRLN